jgi:hypothetical protein
MRPFFSGKDWTELPESVRRSISGETLALIWEDITKAVTSGGFDSRVDRHLSRTLLVLDEKGWDELGELLADVLARALEIQAESAARLAEAGAEGFSTKLEMMHFPSVDDEAAGSSKPAATRSTGQKSQR